MPLKRLLHLDDQSGASQPDGCAAELRSCSIYLGLSSRRSVTRPWNGIAAYPSSRAVGHYWVRGVLANLYGVVCDALDSTGLLAR